MSKPTTSLVKMFEDQRAKKEESTSFQGDRDYNFLSQLIMRQTNSVGGVVQFIPVSTERNPKGEWESAGVDPLDGDILDPQFFANPEGKDNVRLNLRCIIQHEPPKQMLKKYGIDEQREIAFHVPLKNLEESGLISDWRPHGGDIGDLIVWDSTWYQAWNVYRDIYFGQRAKAFFVSFFCNRYRGNSVPTEDVCPNITRSLE